MKTIVYVDGQNFLYGVAEILFNAGVINDKQEISAIDFPFLLHKVLDATSDEAVDGETANAEAAMGVTSKETANTKTMVGVANNETMMSAANDGTANAKTMVNMADNETVGVKVPMRSIRAYDPTIHHSLEIRYYGVDNIQQQTGYGQEVLDRSVKYANNLRRLKLFLWRTGVKYRAVGNLRVRGHYRCKRCGAEEYKYSEKGVDVGLAVDITADVLDHRVDRVVLVSSDTDLAPALRVVLARDVKLTYVALENQMTRALMQLASETLVLPTEDVIEAYARAIKQQ